MHTCDAIEIGARFNNQHSSPSQTWSPSVNFHGNVIRTFGLMTTPLPTFAPKQRSAAHFSAENLNGHNRNRKKLVKIQNPSRIIPAPRSKFFVEYFERSSSIC